ncbi:MAG: phosphatidate cytidylyltransferase [Desulfovermiculus sp.]|nr:phosphatidate cytidylyltransferase [Desulfovermiculus sp.]
MTSHHLRLLTAGVLIVLLAGLIFFAPSTVQAGALGVLCLAALYEFWTMFWSDWTWLKVSGLIVAVPMALAPGLGWNQGLLLLICFWLFCLATTFWGRGTGESSWTDIGIVLAGLIYIPGSLGLLCFMSTMELVFVLAAVAVSDTAAFYGGSRWGKHKLCPSISPQKSWEGSGCGLAACIILSLGVGLIWGQGPWFSWIGIGVALNAAAQLGDLFESALKRGLGVKDSGGLLPGHGGVLDRVDSLLLAVPVYTALGSVYPLWG